MKVLRNILVGLVIIILSFTSAIGGTLFTLTFLKEIPTNIGNNSQEITEQRIVQESSAIVNVAEKSSKSVVSIVVSTANSRRLSSGTGFIVRKDGLVITNRHVVGTNTNVVYKVITNDGE